MKFIISILFFFFIAQNHKGSTSIIIYGSDTCHYCLETKEFLKTNNVAFLYHDIDKNEEKLTEMLSKLQNNGISTSNIQLPVVDRLGTIVMNSADFESFLNKLLLKK